MSAMHMLSQPGTQGCIASLGNRVEQSALVKGLASIFARFLGDRIIALASPGMTPRKASQGQPCPLGDTVPADGLVTVLGAGRDIATCSGEIGRDPTLVET